MPSSTATRTFELDEEAAGWARRFADGSGLHDLLRATRDKLAEALGAEPPKRFVVYLDQGEELYTRANPDEARRFSELVADAAGHEAFSVLLSLRSDYYPAYQNDRAVFDASEHVDVLRPMRDVLGEIIRRPASRFGARFESGDMAERVADATEREPGALPLLSDLMHDMWLHMQARGDGVLRWSDSPKSSISPDRCGGAPRPFLADPSMTKRSSAHLRLAPGAGAETGDPVRGRAADANAARPNGRCGKARGQRTGGCLTLARTAVASPSSKSRWTGCARWPVLKSWLDEERDFLVWKGQVEHTAA